MKLAWAWFFGKIIGKVDDLWLINKFKQKVYWWVYRGEKTWRVIIPSGEINDIRYDWWNWEKRAYNTKTDWKSEFWIDV